jgi:hypothetical protein
VEGCGGDAPVGEGGVARGLGEDEEEGFEVAGGGELGEARKVGED